MKEILKNKGMVLFIIFMLAMAWITSISYAEYEAQKNVVVTTNDNVIQTNK